ncbi:MAG: NADH-quinone oxidoreductase subunit L [Deltaproteobacteria bacterium]|nr:NADH-quinone oxidoreductase subunit L [Deltaproteobacteria bacterium]
MLEFVYHYISVQTLVWLIVALPLAGAVFNGSLALITAHHGGGKDHHGHHHTPFRTLASTVGVLLPFAAFAAALLCFVTLTGFEEGAPSLITGPLSQWTAFPGLTIDIGLKVDQLSLVMALVVTGVGSLIHLYSIGYMSHDDGVVRYFAELNLFLFFMLILVLADNLVLMFVGWEGVGLCSYLLIGFWFEDPAKAKAGTKAFVVNRIGDAGFLLGLFLIYGVMAAAGADPATGYFNFETMSRYAPFFQPLATVIGLLLFVGACGKSAQIPLYVWLPDAMAGPTPVSALIHAATMVTAGVYMVVRLNFIYVLSPTALEVIAYVGAATALFAATMGLAATDIKKILAYSTVSQLGYMFLACGLGAFSAAIFHLVTHAFFKALLFMGAGSVIHALHGEQDIFKMGGLKPRLPVTCWTFLIASLALAGIVPTAGFFSKDAILWHAYSSGHVGLWLVGFVSAGLTAFYIFRLVGAVFFGSTNLPVDQWKRVVESPVSMLIPLILLGFLSAFGGLLGVPEILGGSDRLGEWLSGVVPLVGHAGGGASHAAEIILMVVATIWAANWSILGWVIYTQRRDWPERMAARFRWVYRLIVNRYFVDEIYDRLIVRPLIGVSRVFFWKTIDATAIDAIMVHGTANTVGVWARAVSLAQTGVVQQYLLYFLLGAVIVVVAVAL